MKNDTEITYEITQHIGVISIAKSGWQRELNLVSWNNGEAKYDIRDWAPEHAKMGKGITFNKSELLEIKKLLDTIVE